MYDGGVFYQYYSVMLDYAFNITAIYLNTPDIIQIVEDLTYFKRSFEIGVTVIDWGVKEVCNVPKVNKYYIIHIILCLMFNILGIG